MGLEHWHHHHHHEHRQAWEERRRRHGLRHYFGVHLHRRLFIWFGASILVTSVVFMAMSRHFGGAHGPPRRLLIFGVAATVLWAMSGRVARRLARPLYKLVEVTRRIGAGDLTARAPLDHGPGARAQDRQPRPGDAVVAGEEAQHLEPRAPDGRGLTALERRSQ